MRIYPILFPSLRRPTFGRGRRYVMDTIGQVSKEIGDDTRLFLTTFAGGFLFMAIYLA